MVQPNCIDAFNGSLGVGIGGEQHFTCFGVELARLGQKLRAAHSRHALVGQEKSNGRIALFELPHCLQRLFP